MGCLGLEEGITHLAETREEVIVYLARCVAECLPFSLEFLDFFSSLIPRCEALESAEVYLLGLFAKLGLLGFVALLFGLALLEVFLMATVDGA